MKIALIRLSALGDIILSCIVLQFIKRARPDAVVHFFVDERFKGILQGCAHIDKIYALPLKDRKILRVLRQLRAAKKAHKYELIIDLQGLLKSAIIARLLGRNVYGYDAQSLKEGGASVFYRHKKRISYDENIILRNLALVEFALGVKVKKADILGKQAYFAADEGRILEKINADFKRKFASEKGVNFSENSQNPVNLNENSAKKAKKFTDFYPKILIHIGSSTPNKNYPKERYAILCTLLQNRYKNALFVLTWGSESEKKACKSIVRDIGKNALLAPKLSLRDLTALTSLCDLIIGNDSGPTHLAFAMNKPSITIFGATPSYRNAYQTPINKVIDSGKFISDTKHIDKGDFCIQNIDEKRIFTLAKGLLK